MQMSQHIVESLLRRMEAAREDKLLNANAFEIKCSTNTNGCGVQMSTYFMLYSVVYMQELKRECAFMFWQAKADSRMA